MKQFILITCLAAISHLSAAQPVLEKTYIESVNLTTLESAGEIYYSMDVVNRQCNLYRMDHTLFKTIPLAVPEGYYLEDVRHVSEYLFNEDALIELVYIYSKYNPTTESYYYSYETKLINENGDVLSTYPGAGFTSVISASEQDQKFLAYEYDFSVIPYRTYTHVYSLPGSSTKSVTSASLPETGLVYPNPSDGQVKVLLPSDRPFRTGTFRLFNMRGERIWEKSVSATGRSVILPDGLLVPGTYLYRLESGPASYLSGKVIIR